MVVGGDMYGGGGAGYGANGGSAGGGGGGAYGAYPTVPQAGSGGAGGGTLGSPNGGSGGRGGGLIKIQASNIILNGNITSNGNNANNNSCGAEFGGSAGGGGSGGGIYIITNGSVNASKLSVNGGNGGNATGSAGWYCGGGGGAAGGRVVIQGSSVSGSISRIAGSGGTGPNRNGSNASAAGAQVEVLPYNALGDLGSTTGLRSDATTGLNRKWTNLKWKTETSNNGSYYTQAQVRISDSFGTGSWRNPSTGTVDSWYKLSDSNYDSSPSSEGTLAISDSAFGDVSNLASQTIEIKTRLIGGGNTPTLHEVSLDYDYVNPPTSLSQTDSSDNLIAQDTWTNDSTDKLIFNGTPTVTGNVTPEVVIKSVDIGQAAPSFLASDSATTTNVSAPAVAGVADVELTNLTATASNLAAGKTYYWKSRFRDANGVQSGWSSSTGTFSIEQTPPTGSVIVKDAATNSISYITSTGTDNAILDLSSAVDTGGSGLASYMASEDSTFTNPVLGDIIWQNYTASRAFTLSVGDGTKTVYIKYKDNAGNVGISEIFTSQSDWETAAGTSIDTTDSAGDVKLSSAANYGDGTDGALNVTSGTFNINTQTNGYGGRTAADSISTYTSDVLTSGSSSSFTVNNATGFAGHATDPLQRDEILIANTKTNSDGTQETARILSVSGSTITLTAPVTNSYSGTTSITRIPNYTTVTIASGATLTVNDWTSSTSDRYGLIFFRSNDTSTGVQIDGKIDLTGKGYTGGVTGALIGLGPGGGGAIPNIYYSGGAGYAGIGGKGSNQSSTPGNMYGTAARTEYMGSGGGRGSGSNNGSTGGDGGGRIKFYAAKTTISGTGNIQANGKGGSVGTNNGGGGGGGSGGAIYIESADLTINGILSAAGGGGADHVQNGQNGGDGANGVGGDGGNANGGSGGSPGDPNVQRGDGGRGAYNCSSILAGDGHFSAGGGGGHTDPAACGSGSPSGGGAAGRIAIHYGTVTGLSSPSGYNGPPAGGTTGPWGYYTYTPIYNTSGTIGGTGTGLRVGSPSGDTNKWTSLGWSASNLSATYKIKLQARAADTWGSGDTGYMPLDQESTSNTIWTELTSGTSGTINITNTNLATTKTLEIRAELVSDGGDTPILSDLTVGYATSDSITLDTAAPDMGTLTAKTASAGIPITASAWQLDNDPYFEWGIASGDTAGYFYAMNDSTPETGGTWTTSTNVQLAADSVADGQHTFYVRAKDMAQNVGGAVGSFSIYVDVNNPPKIINISDVVPVTNPPDTTIRLTWLTPDDGGGMIDKFILERKLSTEAWNSAEAKTIANGTQIDITPATQYATLNLTDGGTNYFEDTGLTSGLTYNLRMYAVDKAGNASIVSDEISAYSEDNAEPSVAPSGVSATAASGTSITVNWLPAADGVGIGGYVLYRVQADAPNPPNEWETKLPYLTGSNYELVLPTPIPLGDPRLTFSSGRYYFTDDKNGAGLIDNKLYFYRVRAYDTSNNFSQVDDETLTEQAGDNRLDSEGAPTGSATTPDVTPPSKPITVLASTVSASQIDLDWLDSTDKSNDGVSNGSGVAGYNVYRAGPYDNIQSPPPTDGVYSKLNGPLVISSNYNSTSLAEFKYYYYKIEAIDNATNVSPRSDGASSQTFKDSVPTSPINLNATTPTGDPDDNSFIGRQITLTFNGSNSKYSRIDYYDVYRSEINYGSNAQWLALTPVETIAARTPKNGDGTYTHIDDNTGLYTHESNNLSDNKMYYFKV